MKSTLWVASTRLTKIHDLRENDHHTNLSPYATYLYTNEYIKMIDKQRERHHGIVDRKNILSKHIGPLLIGVEMLVAPKFNSLLSENDWWGNMEKREALTIIYSIENQHLHINASYHCNTTWTSFYPLCTTNIDGLFSLSLRYQSCFGCFWAYIRICRNLDVLDRSSKLQAWFLFHSWSCLSFI